ncbi:MAG: DUF6173 family protein [Methanomassiliicoccales archaeon]
MSNLQNLNFFNENMLKNFEAIKHPSIAVAEQNFASEFCKKLYDQIVEFDSRLDNDKQVAVRLVSFGQTVSFVVTGLGYSNPSLIRFFGTMPEGSQVELIQHVSQISFLLTVTPRENPEQPKRKIGFIND